MTTIIDSAQAVLKDSKRARVIDLETTGLDVGTDEILQIAIIDGKGYEVFHSHVRPVEHDTWEPAMAVNRISPGQLRDAPTLDEIRTRIDDALRDASVIIGYNHIDFDLQILRNRGIDVPDCPFCDVMRDYAEVIGQRDEYGRLRHYSLKRCCEHYGIHLDAHNALNDVRATRMCMLHIAEDFNNRGSSGCSPEQTGYESEEVEE